MNKPHHRIAVVAAFVYLAVVALIVLWPSPVDRPASGQLHVILDWLHQHGIPKFVSYNKVEFAANVAMFVPMGYIAAAWFKKVWLGVVLGALASCVIEVCQAVFLPERFATGLDVLANTIGAWIGVAISCVAHRPGPLSGPRPAQHQMNDSEQ